MQNNFNIEDVRNTIIDAINEKKSFKELREQLPGVRKPRLLALIFDIMEQLGIEKSNHPFPDAMERPRIKRKALTVSADGIIDIKELLDEKGYAPAECIACPTLGKNKLTITVKKR